MKKEVKHFKGENAGRSMTEMLGVLAVIGVLSVGGITGYKLAMNHYVANQIAYEINMLRTDAKVKIAQGAKELTFDEPYNSGHLRYDETYKIGFGFTADSEMPEEDESINGYYVELSDIPKNICKPLANLLKNMNEQAEFEGECNQETNNTLYVAFEAENLSGENTETQPEETPEPEAPTPCEQNCEGGYCNKSGECIICGERIWDPDNEKCICPNNGHWNDVRCVSDDECTGGQKWSDEAKGCVCPAEKPYWEEATETCKSCSSVGDGSKPYWDSSSKTCKTCYEVYGREKPQWDSGTKQCVPCEGETKWNPRTNMCADGGECESNADCGAGKYCYLQHGYYCNQEFDSSKGFGIGDGSSKGECHKVSDDLPESRRIELQNSAGENITYYGSNVRMTWWSACRLCAAKAGGDESDCVSGTTAEPSFMAGWGDPDFKCAGMTNLGSGGYCKADSSQSGGEDNVSEVIAKLKEKIGVDYLWLKNSYNYCHAYYAILPIGLVSHGSRQITRDYPFALCR